MEYTCDKCLQKVEVIKPLKITRKLSKIKTTIIQEQAKKARQDRHLMMCRLYDTGEWTTDQLSGAFNIALHHCYHLLAQSEVK